MYTQKIDCPVCGRHISAYRPEMMPPSGRDQVEDAHRSGRNLGWLRPYRHKGKHGGWCPSHMSRYLLPYRPITEDAARGWYMQKGQKADFRKWLYIHLQNRCTLTYVREV